MSVNENDRFRLHQKLEAVLGADNASTMMELFPPRDWSDYARRNDIDNARTEMRVEFIAVRSEMATEFAAVRSEMATEFAAVRREMTTEFAAVRSEMTTEFRGGAQRDDRRIRRGPPRHLRRGRRPAGHGRSGDRRDGPQQLGVAACRSRTAIEGQTMAAQECE